MDGKLWIRLVKRNKISRDVTVPCGRDTWQEALREACHMLDLSVPIIVPRHLRDWDQFMQTRFLPGDFMDAVHFDRMEAEYFDDDLPRSRDKDPRNA